MAPLLSLRTVIEKAALIVLILGITASVASTMYLSFRVWRKRTLYMIWLLLCCIFLAIANAFALLGCYADPASVPPFMTRSSTVYSLAILTYMLAEIEFALSSIRTNNQVLLRRRIYGGVFLTYIVCWSLRIARELGVASVSHGSLYAIDALLVPLWLLGASIADGAIQFRMIHLIRRLFKEDKKGRDEYTRISIVLCSFLMLCIVFNFGTYIMGLLSAAAFDYASAIACYAMGTGGSVWHIVLSIVLMDTGRRHLLAARSRTSSRTSRPEAPAKVGLKWLAAINKTAETPETQQSVQTGPMPTMMQATPTLI
ncbi:hypothetical protein BC831DRAFT_453505 [Entophlyctis helioformis]|nr:hypothetical protein BC831DRAFT_453505 [Entophlyctis helioformis]